VQDWRVRRLNKRRLSIYAQFDHRLCPGRWVVLVAACIAPEDGSALIGKITPEGRLDFYKSVEDELVDLSIT
jgi:hypothetical protein